MPDKTVTTPNIPDDWYVCWLGRDRDGNFVAQLALKATMDPEDKCDDHIITFVSRTGQTWLEALSEAILVIEKEELEDES